MPLYEITHASPLTTSQQDSLATRITHLHATMFTAPTHFVNVKFINNTSQSIPTYVGGKRRSVNTIQGYVRSGSSRPREMFDKLSAQIAELWEEIVVAGAGKEKTNGANGMNSQSGGQIGTGEPLTLTEPTEAEAAPKELHAVFILPSIGAGWEAGFLVPEAGKDGQWIKENMGKFEKKAEEGDQVFRDLVEEIKARKELQ